MRNSCTLAALAAALCTLALAACDRDDMQRADRAGAEVGRKADAAIAKAKDAATDAAHRTRETLSEAGKRLEDATRTEGGKAESPKK